MFEITHFYDLNSEIKLGSKSLLLKYFETLFMNIEYLDEVNTVNNLLNIVIEDNILEQINLSQDSFKLYPKFQELNSKTLIKLLNPTILKDEMEANYYNLDYDDLIIFQLDLVEKIYKSNTNKALCIVDIPLLTNKILIRINSVECNNIKILVFPIDVEDKIFNEKNTFILNNFGLDLCNEEDIYNIVLESSKNYNLEEMKNSILNLLNENYTNNNVDYIKTYKK